MLKFISLPGVRISPGLKKWTSKYKMDMLGTVTSPPPLGVGISGLRYQACENITANLSELGAFCSNATENTDGYGLNPTPEQQSLALIQKVVSVVVPLLFGLIVVVGLFGNALVSTTTCTAGTKYEYNRTQLIRFNWDGDPSGYADNPDNWIFLWKWVTWSVWTWAVNFAVCASV